MMYEIYILYMVFGEILYRYNVVVLFVQKIVVKYGARTHSAR